MKIPVENVQMLGYTCFQLYWCTVNREAVANNHRITCYGFLYHYDLIGRETIATNFFPDDF